MKRFAAALLALGIMCGCDLAFSTVGSWTTERRLAAPIAGSYVIALGDGRLGIFGGFLAGGQPSNETLLYDLATGTWVKGAPRPGPAFADVIAVRPEGTALVEGGRDINGNFQGATSLYDPVRNIWSQAGSVIEPRIGPSSTLLSDGRLMIAGGSVLLAQPEQTPNGEVDFRPIATAEIYDPATRKWSLAGGLEEARNGITLLAIGGGGAIMAGGRPRAGGGGAARAGRPRYAHAPAPPGET